MQTMYQWENRVTVCEEQPGDEVSENIMFAVLQNSAREPAVITPDDVRSGSRRSDQLPPSQGDVDSASRFGSHGRKGKGSQKCKGKSAFFYGKPRHNKNECRNFLVALRKKSVQPDRAGRYAGVEVDSETGRRNGGKGTGVSPAP